MEWIDDTCAPGHKQRLTPIALFLLVLLAGCRTHGSSVATKHLSPVAYERHSLPREEQNVAAPGQVICQVAHTDDLADSRSNDQKETSPSENAIFADSDDWPSQTTTVDLPTLEMMAAGSHPGLRRLHQQTAAAWAKTRYIDKLPDPVVGANVFGHPIETAAGSQRANLTVMQMIPWLERLDAQAQQACYEAMSLQQEYEAERVRIIGELRVRWARLYVLQRQRQTIAANQQLIESLTKIVTARLALNRGSAGDVTLLTVELGRLKERSISVQQQIVSTTAEINRLAGRPAAHPIAIPNELPVELANWNYEMLRQAAWQQQPLIAAAHLKASATRWGIEVAKLHRRPDVSIGAAWHYIENNRPPSGTVDVGRDAWSLGAQVSIPLQRQKYDAMQDEATWRHAASHASLEDLRLEFDAIIRDQWEQAVAAHETATLYQSTILPQARQTLESDQQALANGTVDLDRVIQDIRNLLALELGYHRAIGQMATATARIQQAVGQDLSPEHSDRAVTSADLLQTQSE
ncbi:MAG: TolC family protein [Planctomycetaceae bacterium]